MEILADYHTHTVYSHGKGSIEDNVKVAISKGIKKIGMQWQDIILVQYLHL